MVYQNSRGRLMNNTAYTFGYGYFYGFAYYFGRVYSDPAEITKF